MTRIHPDAQLIIERLAGHSWKQPRIDRNAVEVAILRHLSELGLPPQPFRWFSTAADGYRAARSAAWSAAESAAASAARSAAESAARSAAEINALSVFNHSTQAKLAAIWLPMVDAFNAGLWLYWITPTEIICIEQPCLRINDNRLHCSDGPAVHWPAGESYYFWRGTQVPDWYIIDKSKITGKAIKTEENAERRRIMCEIIGWENAIGMLEARLISKDELWGEPRELFESSILGGRFVRVRNGTIEPDGTRRTFVISCARDATTPHEAIAIANNIASERYAEQGRT